MIPVKYLEELKTAPVEEVDFVATFIEVSLHQIHARQYWLDTDEDRCLRANIRPWAAGQHCIHALSKHS